MSPKTRALSCDSVHLHVHGDRAARVAAAVGAQVQLQVRGQHRGRVPVQTAPSRLVRRGAGHLRVRV